MQWFYKSFFLNLIENSNILKYVQKIDLKIIYNKFSKTGMTLNISLPNFEIKIFEHVYTVIEGWH